MIRDCPLKRGPTEKTFKIFELQGVWFDQIFAAIVFSTLIKHWTHLFVSNVDVIWCHWMSFNVIWYLAMSFNVFWCLVMPFYAFWCLSMPFDAFWCLFMSFDVFWWLLMVCDVFRCLWMAFNGFGWLSFGKITIFRQWTWKWPPLNTIFRDNPWFLTHPSPFAQTFLRRFL